VITEPLFYAAAVPAVLLMGLSKSGFGSGFGSLAVPIMALAVAVPEAAAIFMPILLLMDVLGITAFRKHFQWSLLKRLIPLGLMGTVVGTLTFKHLSPPAVSVIVGMLTLLFLALRLYSQRCAASQQPLPQAAGAVLAVVSGFTSFVAHAGGPPINAYVMGLRLTPLHFTATMAVFFFVINLSKWLPYSYLGLFSWDNISTSLVLLPLAPLGVWAGVRIAHRIQPAVFYRLIEVGMLLTGLKLVAEWRWL
tara:strand:+ start:120 stop:869 length:750 start_codon:yes stop_codon:yes gene_type:complete